MKHHIKKIISIFSSAMLVFSGVQGSYAFADADYTELMQGDLTFQIYSDHAVVSDCVKEVESVTVPREVSGVPVTEIGERAFDTCQMETVELPDTLTLIRDEGFTKCRNLTKLTIPEGVTEIGAEAFYACGFESMQLPDTLKIIHDSAFNTCKSLKTVVIPEGVTEVGALAFDWCLSMESAILPDSLTIISEGLFGECPKLTKIELGDRVTEIKAGAFDNDRALRGLTLPVTVTKIGERAFKESGINTIIIPDGITKLEEGLFKDCRNLRSVVIPESVTEIEDSVFSGCIWLPEISIPASVTKIGYAVFQDCYNLQSVNLPDTVTEISDNMFESCHSLREFSIPDQITRIGEYAFDRCEKLEKITIGKSVQEIGIAAFRYTVLQTINVDAENPYYSSVDGVLFNADQSTLLRFPEGRIGSYTIPDSVNTIGESAFENTVISQVIIPDTVKKIEDDGFSDNNALMSIEIPESVTEIGIAAFNYCDDLQSVIIHNPECSFGYQAISFGFTGTIYGLSGSTAEQYAAEYNLKFESIGEAPQQCKGDYNADGEVTVADAVLLARFVSEDMTLTAKQITDILKAEPDYDSDGFVTILDAASLLNKLGEA